MEDEEVKGNLDNDQTAVQDDDISEQGLSE